MSNRTDYIKYQIKTRTSITRVVQYYSGAKVEKGECKCPLHNEKTASFKLNEEKGIYYCFGCGAGGDQISFVMQYLGIGFHEAMNMIDRDFALGVTGERISVKAQIAMREVKRRQALEKYEINSKSVLYNELCLKYKIVNTLLKHLEPLTDIWGEMITRKAWLEYTMDKVMEGMCK